MALQTPAARLEEAKAALHNLLIGQGVQRVRDSNGDEVAYTTANVSRLRAYIADLEAEIAGAVRYGGPMRPMFL